MQSRFGLNWIHYKNHFDNFMITFIFQYRKGQTVVETTASAMRNFVRKPGRQTDIQKF